MVEGNDLLRSKGLYMRLEVTITMQPFRRAISSARISPQAPESSRAVNPGSAEPGARLAHVPDVVGQQVEQAESQLQPRGIKINRVVYVRSETVPRERSLRSGPNRTSGGGEQFSILVSLGGSEKSETVARTDRKKKEEQ
jgi:hypothetical protein